MGCLSFFKVVSHEISLELTNHSFVVQDDRHNYLSARYPPDAEELAKKTVELVKGVLKTA